MCNRRAYYKHWNRHHGAHMHGWGGHHGRRGAWKARFHAAFNQPPANVRELDDKYELLIFAPGFEKEDFIIALTDQTLKVSVEQRDEAAENWKRKEYALSGFEREFLLNDIINKEAIEATYEQGVLIITLPKLEGFETSRSEITIS